LWKEIAKFLFERLQMRFAKESFFQANRLKSLNEVTKNFRQSQVLGTLVFHNLKKCHPVQ
jgi:hypothetical protein